MFYQVKISTFYAILYPSTREKLIQLSTIRKLNLLFETLGDFHKKKKTWWFWNETLAMHNIWSYRPTPLSQKPRQSLCFQRIHRFILLNDKCSKVKQIPHAQVQSQQKLHMEQWIWFHSSWKMHKSDLILQLLFDQVTSTIQNLTFLKRYKRKW